MATAKNSTTPKPPKRPVPPTKDEIREIADEAARIAGHIEQAGVSAHARLSVNALRKGRLLGCIGAVASQGPLIRELAPARRIDIYGRDVQIPAMRKKVYEAPLSADQLAGGEGELLAYLNQVLILCGRASGKIAPEAEIVTGLRSAAEGLRRWAGPAGEDAKVRKQAGEEFVLNRTEKAILKALKETGELKSQSEIMNAVEAGHGTVKDALQTLERLKYVHRPRGERSGYTVTEGGSKAVGNGD